MRPIFPLVVVIMALAVCSRQSLAQTNSQQPATSTNVGGSGRARPCCPDGEATVE
jgi:hypothetical protein